MKPGIYAGKTQRETTIIIQALNDGGFKIHQRCAGFPIEETYINIKHMEQRLGKIDFLGEYTLTLFQSSLSSTKKGENYENKMDDCPG